MAKRKKLTVLDIQNLKGKEQIIMTASNEGWIARAAEEAGVHILRCWGWGTAQVPFNDDETQARNLVDTLKYLRRFAPSLIINPLMPPAMISPSDEEAIRWGCLAMSGSADIVLMLGVSPQRIEAVAKQKIPVFGHVGLTPIWYTQWTGGYVGVGKTAETALQIYKDALAYQEAGAAMLTIELTPHQVTAEIAKRLRIPVISIGAGPGADGQELVVVDLLGLLPGSLPRHAKKYRNFYDEAVSAFREFGNDVISGAFPAKEKNALSMKDEEFDRFLEGMERIKP
jgi:3-methyl-2-oxobutanoate hydroxymethyltransferase